MTSPISKATQRIALITGCSNTDSLGFAIATQLQRGGWRVFATARKIDSAGVRGLAAVGCDALALDVTEHASIKRALSTVAAATGGRLDLLVNNAAAWARETALDADIPKMKAMYDTNVFGPLDLIQQAAPMLLETSLRLDAHELTGKKKPMIVNIGSTAGAGVPWQIGYSSSKAATNVASEVLRLEVKGLGLEVLTVIPGGFKTTASAHIASAPFPVSAFYPTITAIGEGVSDFFHKGIPGYPMVSDIAGQIVKSIEKGRGGQMYLGGGAFLSQYVLGWLPYRWADALWGKLFVIDRVAPPSLAEVKKLNAARV